VNLAGAEFSKGVNFALLLLKEMRFYRFCLWPFNNYVIEFLALPS
jgi:hypothetical protein